MASSKYQESELEIAALEWLAEELGYETTFGPDIGPEGDYPERDDYSDVVLIERFKESLFAFNKHIPKSALEEAVREVLVTKHVALIENNKAFHKYITDGITVSYKDKEGNIKHEQAFLFDFENVNRNNFLAVNQFVVIENRVKKIPDIVIFVNGLPLVVFELKTVSNEEVSITDAFYQIKTYQNTISNLFVYNAFNVISDGVNTKAGTLTSNEERYMSWRTIDGSGVEPNYRPSLEVLLKGMFDKERLLDILKQFILFQADGNDTYKILAGYHQFHAVNKAINTTYEATSNNGDRRIGVIWHTQGSGKSLSMVFYTGKLVISEKLGNPTIIVITDRNDLDDQLFGTFSKSSSLLRGNPTQAGSRDHLREILNGRDSGGIIFTTIHKFAPDENGDSLPLTKRKNVIVMADEAHRSQYGFSAKVVQGKEEAYEKYGYAKYMRDSLPNASYIGFTGTPIELTDKNTRAVFGDYIDVYDMSRAVEDGTTVKIFYESRIAQLDFSEDYSGYIDDEFEEITEYQEEVEKQKQKRKWARLEAIVGSKERVKMVAEDIVKHFEERQYANESEVGKAMIVAMSRRIAVEIYDAIIKLRPSWHNEDLQKGRLKVVMTSSSSDPDSWGMHKTTKSDRDTLSKRMKDNNDELEIVIVRDMWLTGFDVPSMHTMYLDKPMKGHNLMQAIARVNRVFREKQGGLIVDYIGIADKLKEALTQYTDDDKKTTGVDTELAASIMMEKLDLIKEILHEHDYSKFFGDKKSDKLSAIVETVDFIINLREDRKKDYIQNVTELSKAFSLCSTTETAEIHNLEVGFHKSVRAALIKIATDDSGRKTIKQLDEELNQLISKSLKSDKVIDILAETGLSKPNIAILSDEFLEEFKHMKHKNLAVELLNRLLKGKIRVIRRKSIVQARKFSELLEVALLKYQNRAIETTMVILELIELAKDLTKAENISKDSGLTEDEFAFYEALQLNDLAKQIMGDEKLKMIATELTRSIKNSVTVDWNIRDSVRAKMRSQIKRLLKKYGYPPDNPREPNNYDNSVKIIMEQTELVCENEV